MSGNDVVPAGPSPSARREKTGIKNIVAVAEEQSRMPRPAEQRFLVLIPEKSVFRPEPRPPVSATPPCSMFTSRCTRGEPLSSVSPPDCLLSEPSKNAPLCSLRQTSAGKSTRTSPSRFQHARGTTISARVHAALSPFVERCSRHFPQSRKNERIRQTAFPAYLRRPTDEKILWHRPVRDGNGPLIVLDKNNGQGVYIF